MIKLTKTAEPIVLARNAASWTRDLMSYVNSGLKVPDEVKNKYNQQEVRDALKCETNGKCMYCEGYIGAVSYPHIEHFRPKVVYPDKTFEWANLGLGCQVCNSNKNDSFDENLPYINPYYENPDDFFIFLGTMVMQKPGCARAENMKNRLKLNRPELMEQRKTAIEKVTYLVERYKAASNPSIKEMLKKNIEVEMGPDKEYSRCVKAAVEQMTQENW
ncbi:MAG: TIGR02646 family protein [Bacteroidales bacterium]|nr:TIGR02646 family protein [Bacteroidales bacterium]